MAIARLACVSEKHARRLLPFLVRYVAALQHTNTHNVHEVQKRQGMMLTMPWYRSLGRAEAFVRDLFAQLGTLAHHTSDSNAARTVCAAVVDCMQGSCLCMFVLCEWHLR